MSEIENIQTDRINAQRQADEAQMMRQLIANQQQGLAGQGLGQPKVARNTQPGLAGQNAGMQQTIADLSEMIVSGNREDAIRATQFAQEDPQMMEALKPAILARQQAEARQMVR